jgi:hypothetical protein
MTVAELIEKLQQFPPDMTVMLETEHEQFYDIDEATPVEATSEFWTVNGFAPETHLVLSPK